MILKHREVAVTHKLAAPQNSLRSPGQGELHDDALAAFALVAIELPQ
jgi:hypothetical protein